MQNTWYIFSNSTPTNPNEGPKGVKTWDGRTLYYYQPGTTMSQNPQNSLSDFLVKGTGRCGMWAELLQDAWAINGVASTNIDAQTSNGYGYLWANKWIINQMPGYWVGLSTEVGIPADLLPTPTNGNYNAMTNTTGAAGQNSPTPSQKCWPDHAFQQYGSLYYDPSYGLIHFSPTDLQTNCMTCFGNYMGQSGSQQIFSVEQPSETVIVFVPE